MLNRGYAQFDYDDEVRASVLAGAGDAFWAGADFSTPASPFGAPATPEEFTAAPTDPATGPCPQVRCSRPP